MDERFRDCPKECPLEEDSKWLAEKASEIIRNLESQVTKLSLQLEKVLEAFGPDSEDVPCPSNVGLVDSLECGIGTECQQCWRDALEAVGEEVT